MNINEVDGGIADLQRRTNTLVGGKSPCIHILIMMMAYEEWQGN